MKGPTGISAQVRQAQRKEAQDGYLKEEQKKRQAMLEKTARLRALRLAKEAADRVATEAGAKPVVKKKAPAKPALSAANALRMKPRRAIGSEK